MSINFDKIRSEKNVAVIIVSSNTQDVERQRSEFERFAKNYDVQFDYIELKGRKRTQFSRSALDVIQAKYGNVNINQWRHTCDRYGTADTWDATKLELKKLPNKIKCFVISPCIFEITDKDNEMQTNMLFIVSTQEIRNNSKRILGGKKAQCLNGEHTGGDIPYPCDVSRQKDGVEILHIQQLRSSMTNIKNRNPKKWYALGWKYKLTYPDGKVELVNKLPLLQGKKYGGNEKNKYVITKDATRIIIIREIFDEIKDKVSEPNWTQIAKSINSKYGDNFGNGWTGNRIKSLITNYAVIGKPSIGKSCKADIPSLIIRDPDKEDGYAHNDKEISGRMPEKVWIIPEKPIFAPIIDEEVFFQVKDKIVQWNNERKQKLEEQNKILLAKGLKKISEIRCDKHHALRDLIWDVVCDYPCRVTNKKILCSIACCNSKGSKDIDCGTEEYGSIHLAMTPFKRVLNDYIQLNEWQLLDENKINSLLNNAGVCPDAKHGEMARLQSNAQIMWDFVNKYLPKNDVDELGQPQSKEQWEIIKQGGDYLEKMYLIALERANEPIQNEIKELNKKIENINYSIETADDKSEIPSLRKRLIQRENEVKQLQEQLASSVIDKYRKDKANLLNLLSKIKQMRSGDVDELDVKELFTANNIKVFVDNKCRNTDDFIVIKSTTNDALPQLHLSYKDWRKYCNISLANRPQHFQKGHHYCPRNEFKKKKVSNAKKAS